jgi:hypothetical protein
MPAVIDIAKAPAAFVIVYDSEHHVLASSGRLDGRIPGLPAGVLAWVATPGPAPSVRKTAGNRSRPTADSCPDRAVR